ncbi:hypothetical protein [Stenotrophomonas sp. NPDC077659]|uniref:hypothetical protein n=1 Tax=Stenotrophomonas sp. NPDC077659 TaxID=3390694 RepID=UPI003D077297
MHRINQGVARLDAEAGRTPDAASERNDPAHLRASMATAVAAQTPADTSFERAEQLTQAAQVRTQEEQQHRQVQEQSGPRMV